MRVAVTRAEPGADETAQRLIARGAEVIVAPLLSTHFLDPPPPSGPIQALLFTSANGARAAARSMAAFRAAQVLCVGDATAQAARAHGFSNAMSADGDAAALIARAAQLFRKDAGALVHVSGADLAVDVADALRQAGFSAERVIAYRAQAVDALPEALARALRATPPLDAVIFHSPRAARIFAQLATDAPTDALDAACISAEVAHAAATLPWRRMIVAEAPRDDALVRAILP